MGEEVRREPRWGQRRIEGARWGGGGAERGEGHHEVRVGSKVGLQDGNYGVLKCLEKSHHLLRLHICYKRNPKPLAIIKLLKAHSSGDNPSNLCLCSIDQNAASQSPDCL